MNHSKYGLNAPFYKWLDEVRRAMRKEQELLHKLEYYNVKFMGYQGFTYDRIGSSTKNNSKGDQNLLYWLDKLDEVERKLSVYHSLLVSYHRYFDYLDGIEEKIIRFLIEGKSSKRLIVRYLDISIEKYDRMLNRAIRKWELEINKPIISEKH